MKRKYVTTGRNTDHKFEVSWDPDTISVPAGLYAAIEPGGTVCVHLRPGALGVKWFTVESCR